MILETIFMWVGGLLLISFLFFALVFLWLKCFDRFWYNSRISIKAIYYDIIYNSIKDPRDDLQIKVGSSYYMNYKGKKYLWKIVEGMKLE